MLCYCIEVYVLYDVDYGYISAYIAECWRFDDADHDHNHDDDDDDDDDDDVVVDDDDDDDYDNSQ